MNFPYVEYTWLGYGTVIAIIAIIHVIISHGVAIGTSVLTVSLEYRAFKTENEKLDELAKTMAKWVLIITTTVGAMTGVGIWFSTTVIQPDSIGALLRIFFWAWVTEWIVFITEVVILIIYYYTWDSWKSPEKKKKHINLGISLSVASWLTMAIITGVLAAKLTPGKWIDTFSFWNAFLNPTYLPSLGFRMFLAMMLAIVVVAFLLRLFVKDLSLREEAFKVFGVWGAISLPMTFILGLWYLWSIPEQAYDMIVWSTGMTENTFKIINGLAFLILIVFLVWLIRSPKTVPIILSLAVFGASIGFIGEFEVVRESIRKPFIIYDYMYANGLLYQNQEKINEEGYLAHSTWIMEKEITEENKVEVGREVFAGQCLSCHTIDGWREKRALGKRLVGWDEEALKTYIPTMHNVRVAMPPFMGTEEELDALVAYLKKEIDEVNGVKEVSQSE
ncbi:MAG: cytochrome c [Lysinibacillus sp.]|nr:cytochrome c [Lysinibacillus sp.]